MELGRKKAGDGVSEICQTSVPEHVNRRCRGSGLRGRLEIRFAGRHSIGCYINVPLVECCLFVLYGADASQVRLLEEHSLPEVEL